MNTNINDLNENKLYAIKEAHNLAAVTSAPSITSLLNSNVWITDPKISVCRIMEFMYADYAPAVFVKVSYSGTMNGSSVLIFKQSDAQLMLCQLMGMPPVVTPDFNFDEINISAFGEIISQLMNAYFTEVAGFIGGTLSVSGVEVLPNSINQNIFTLMSLKPDDNICILTSGIRTDTSINSRFVTILPVDLAAKIAENTEARFPMPEPSVEPVPDFSSTPEANNPYDTTGAKYAQSPFASSPDSSLSPQSAFTTLSEQPVTFSSFENTLTQEQLNNLRLLMNVPLELSIEIGSTQRRVDEILSFSHGTVIELDSPADAPVNVIVNGHLIAKGDVVVVDDYFAVRVTEIIKSNLIDTLRNEQK